MADPLRPTGSPPSIRRPLRCLHRAGYNGRVSQTALPIYSSHEDARTLKSLARAGATADCATAVRAGGRSPHARSTRANTSTRFHYDAGHSIVDDPRRCRPKVAGGACSSRSAATRERMSRRHCTPSRAVRRLGTASHSVRRRRPDRRRASAEPIDSPACKRGGPGWRVRRGDSLLPIRLGRRGGPGIRHIRPSRRCGLVDQGAKLVGIDSPGSRWREPRAAQSPHTAGQRRAADRESGQPESLRQSRVFVFAVPAPRMA
jgi:hypothetical protein